MRTMIPMLLFVSAAATGFAPQSAAQKTNQPEKPVASMRVPVDFSLQGLGGPSTIGLTATTSCLDSIQDRGSGGNCLMASSTPSSGVLFPYPGINNTFVAPAFVGGGENNQATGGWSTVGGGRNNDASGDYATVAGGGARFSGNTASGKYAAVGGGVFNTASGKGAARRCARGRADGRSSRSR